MNQAYWEKRYSDQLTGWDIGKISDPVRHYIDQLTDPNLKILIPGCGYGHEAAYLNKKGFSQVYVLDFAQAALDQFQENNPDFPENYLIRDDFFKHRGNYELILEQTLFCAIDPKQRSAYVSKMFDLLRPGGKLTGVLFDREFEGGPPFGGSRTEYLNLFREKFTQVSIERCYNSIPQRMGTEVFIKIIK